MKQSMFSRGIPTTNRFLGQETQVAPVPPVTQPTQTRPPEAEMPPMVPPVPAPPVTTTPPSYTFPYLGSAALVGLGAGVFGVGLLIGSAAAKR